MTIFFLISGLKSGGGVVIALFITAEGVAVGCMQALTEWQKYKLRKAGIHHNIQVNQTQQGSDLNHQKSVKENGLVDTRIFAILVVGLCAMVILYKYDLIIYF